MSTALKLISYNAAGANTYDSDERQCLHKMRQRLATGQHYLHHDHHHNHDQQEQYHHDHDHDQVTAREGKPILIIEEGDTETAAWAQHSLEVAHDDDDDVDSGRSNKKLVEKCEASFIGWALNNIIGNSGLLITHLLLDTHFNLLNI